MNKLAEPLLPLGLQVPETIVHALNTRGYGFIPFVPPPGLIDKVLRGWNDFLKLPHTTRMKWQCGNDKDYDDGYVSRCKGCEGCAVQQAGAPQDNKHFFHYRPYLVALLEHKHVDFAQQLSWLEDLHKLYEFCRSHFLKVLEQLDSDYREFDFAKRFDALVANTQHVVRLLSYNEPMRPGQLLGKAHNDRNFGTIQVFETHPALVLNLPGGKHNYIPREGQALVFTGDKAVALTHGKLHAVNHAVIVPDDFVQEGSVTSRQSIVFFGHINQETF